MPEIDINFGDRSYVITIGRGTIAKLGNVVATVRMPSLAVVVSNPTISRHWSEAACESLRSGGIRTELVTVPAGERFKTLGTVSHLYDALLEFRMDRAGALVALGGGVIGDMVGFTAATYMRGIDFYQVPTTLLAQVDASIGGKTGVDLPQGKNLVGAFHQPRAVVIDTATLDTLPMRELRSGLAEVVKHGIISDRGFFAFLDDNARVLLGRDHAALEHAVRRSVEIKRDVVQADERESGLRAILNHGHTVGHAIEVVGGYGKYRHGEASAIGMVTEAIIAEREGYAQEPVAGRIAALLMKMRLPVDLSVALATSDLVRAIELDKKVIGGEIRLALPTRIGECRIIGVGREAIAGAIDAHKKHGAT